MPLGLIAVIALMGSLAVREVGYLAAKHHQDKAAQVETLKVEKK